MFHRPHWSYSALTQYMTCPLRYYFQRILRLPQASISSSLVFGSSVHAALAVYHQALQERTEPNLASIHKALTETWSNTRQTVPIQFKVGETREDLISQGIALLDLYLQQEPPRDILAVEKEFLSPVFNSQGEYLETPLVAVADLITGNDTDVTIQEFKTASKAYSDREVASSLQPACYVLAVWETLGHHAEVEYQVLVKTKVPKLQTLRTRRTLEDLGRLGDIVERVEKAVSLEIFYPVETSLNCGTCPYRQPCKEWGRANPAVNYSTGANQEVPQPC